MRSRQRRGWGATIRVIVDGARVAVVVRGGVILLIGIVFAGCGASHPRSSPNLTASPTTGLWDAPLHVRASGLNPGAGVIVRAMATDQAGTRWSSQAVFTADANGVADLTREDATGLLSRLQPRPASASYFFPPDAAERISLALVVSGRRVASANVTRTLRSSVVSVRRLSLLRSGISGFYAVRRGAVRRTAVMILGGSEGGADPALAELLASRGYPTLALAYFGAPGLPPRLDRIPLEYFARALLWLDRQPAVDPGRVVVWGGSRGSEAALLLGVHFPHLVHAVIALSPSSVVNGAIEARARLPARTSAWTLRGKQIAFSTARDDPTPSGSDARAIIPVELIHGPILTVAGGFDRLWNSSGFAAAIHRRLIRDHDRWSHLNYYYAHAGHLVAIAIPNTAAAASAETVAGRRIRINTGGDPASDDEARRQLWPHLLAFLRHV